MKLLNFIPTVLGIVSLFFISSGLWLGSTINYALTLGFIIGIIFFLLAGKVTDILKRREENNKKMEEYNVKV